MKFAAALLVATVSAEQLFDAEINLADNAVAPVCDLSKSPRCGDDKAFKCLQSATGAFFLVDNTPISLDFSPVVSVCFPVDADGKATAADYKLTMSTTTDKGTAPIATGTYPAASFLEVTGAKALVASAVAALSAVYMM